MIISPVSPRSFPRITALSAALATCLACSIVPADPSAGASVRSLDPAPLPILGGSMALVGDVLIVADADRDQIHLVSTEPYRLLHTFELADGSRPGRIAVGEERAWVVLTGSGSLATVELSATPTLSLRSVCPAPRSVAAIDGQLFVACVGGQLFVAVGEGPFEEREATLPPDVRDVTFRARELTFTGLRGGVLSGLSIDETTSDPLWQRTLAPLEGESGLFQPSAAPRTRASGDITRVLYVAGRIGPPTEGVDGNQYLGGSGDDPCSIGAFSYALASLGSTDLPGSVARLNLGELVVPVDFDTRRDSTGRTLVAVVSPTGVGGAEAPLKVYRLGGELNACHESIAEYPLEGQAVSVTAVGDKWAVQLREPAALWFDGEVLPLDARSVRDTGHDLFYLPLAGQAACASCHLEGLDDGHAWTNASGQGSRTLSLAGGVSDRLGFSWEATPPDLRQLAREHFAGAGASLSNEQLDAFILWLDSLRPPRLAFDEEEAARGRAIFTERCTACHDGEGRSNVALAEIGARSTRVPELVGVGSRTHLMREGCAESLDELMGESACGDEEHYLEDAQERASVVEFLRSL